MKKKFTSENAAQNNVEITCPHCGKTGNKPTMMRWHFDNCKQNPNKIIKEPTMDTSKKAKRSTESDMGRDPYFNPFKEGTDWHKMFHEKYITHLPPQPVKKNKNR